MPPNFKHFIYFYFFGQWAILISTSKGRKKKTVATLQAPQNRSFYWKMECQIFYLFIICATQLWGSYTWEISITLGWPCPTKVWCYWEHLEEPFENLIGTRWEQQNNSPWHLSPNAKEKNCAMLSLLIGHMKIKVHKISTWASSINWLSF